jgi:hypothetical protein
MAETVEQYKARISSSGGKGLVKKRGKKYMKQIHKKGLEKRWGKKKKNRLKALLFD